MSSLKKWEASLLGAALLTLLSMMFVVGTDAPPVTVFFGVVAGWIGGGVIWTAMQDQN